MMGSEHPIRTSKAHVYRTTGEFSKQWVPLGGGEPLDISFHHDVPRNLYRLICMHNNSSIVNSTMTPEMEFMRTSSKFGQWFDEMVAVTYGVGFDEEEELSKFGCFFDEMRWRSGHDQLSSGLSLLNKPISDELTFDQLRYENDRLKVALAQSCCNVKVWERELACLRETNQRLRGAIEESMLNVEKWNDQLRCLNDENHQLKNQVMEISVHQKADVNKRLKDVGCRIHNAENILTARDKEIERLKGMMEEYASLDECKMKNITQRLSTAEMLLVAKDKEMDELKGRIGEVAPRLKEAENLLISRDKEMETFKYKLKKYEELERTSKLYRGAAWDNSRLKCELNHIQHNNMTPPLRTPLANQRGDMALGEGLSSVTHSLEIRSLQEKFNKKVKELYEINEDILRRVE